MKNGILLTVRTNSTRLPQKALKKLNNNLMTIEFLVNRLKKKFNNKIDIILCTIY